MWTLLRRWRLVLAVVLGTLALIERMTNAGGVWSS